jgi:hypothetical protein
MKMSNFREAIVRDELQLIVDLLNALIENQPDLINLLKSSAPIGEIMMVLNYGMPANEAVQDMKNIRCRPTIDGNNWITVTGIISAIGRVIGADAGLEIRSKWEGEGDDYHLVGFCVGEGVMPLID